MHAVRLKLFYWLTIRVIATGNYLKCSKGNNINFKCPCCPEEFDDCRFKKLFQGGYLVRDGALNDLTKYELDEDKGHITLKECNEDDEGTYVWMCGRCNVNKQFHVQVQRDSDERLQCSAGGEISFECPCCADELDSCRFKKLEEEEEYIVRDGVSSDRHPRFEFDEHKTHITLRECNQDDEGTYVWMCRDYNKQFHLEVNEDIKPLTWITTITILDVKMRRELNKSTTVSVNVLSMISLVSISLINFL